MQNCKIYVKKDNKGRYNEIEIMIFIIIGIYLKMRKILMK